MVELLTVYPDRLWRNRPVLSHVKVSYRSQLFQEFPELEEKDIRQAPEPMRLLGRDKVLTLPLN